MPSKSPVPHLRDILENTAHIQRVLTGVSYETYAANRDISALTERYLQIVTEAAYRLQEDADIICPGPNWKGWRDLGNVLRHVYDKVDPELIWNTIRFDLPQLRQAVAACLQRMENGTGSPAF